ncbi:hypothetical protein B0H21DRAFT_742583 [Amylocystis lapponica]|nr:hypothetical protein B0H21DRAFT_742583 [Amylocystis lapponica]
MDSLRWGRKSSTPFFPGAWPNSSAQDYDDRSPDTPTDHMSSPAKSRNPTQQWMFPTTMEKHNFEDVVATSRRDICGSPATPEFGAAPLSASFSQESNLTEASTVTSEGITTPEFIDPTTWSSHTNFFQPKSDFVSRSGSFGSLPTRHHQGSSTPDITIEAPSPASSSPHVHLQRLASTYLDEPLFTSDISPLSLPLSDFSFSFGNSEFCATNQNHVSRASTGSGPLPFVETLSNAEQLNRAKLQLPSETATNFYPVPDAELEDQLTPSISSSSYSHYTDSPVLPAEGGPGRSASPVPQITVRPFSPTSADLDAFALAAGAATVASQSSLSIPTSFRSVSASASMSAYASACETSRAQTHESAVASLAVATACASMDTVDRCHYGYQCNCGFDPDVSPIQGREPIAPSPLTRARTVSSRVDVGVRAGALAKGERPARSLMLGKMRKLGGRIKNLLKTGRMSSPSGELGVKTTTTTAVTAVEYQSVSARKTTEM